MSSKSRVLPSAILLAGLVAPLPAQLIGPNPGVIFVSPLGEHQPASTPSPSGAQRRAARVTAARVSKLDPIRKSSERAARISADAERARTDAIRVGRLESAVRHVESARRRLDALRARYAKDEEFLRDADELGFELRKQLARSKRELEDARAKKAAAESKAAEPR